MIKIRNIISVLVMAVILFLFANYLSRHLSDFAQIFSLVLSPIAFLLIIILIIIVIINIFMTGHLLDILTQAFGIRLRFKESFGLAIITRFYNTITPFRGGMAARAIYLKKKHNFAYVHFLATLSAICLIIFMISAFVGMASMLFIWYIYGLFNPVIFFLFLGIFLTMLVIIILSPKFRERQNKWANRIIKVINGWHLIKNNGKIISTVTTRAIIQLILGALNQMVLYYIFNINLGFSKALFLSSIASISIIVSITPGNLGIGDAINVFSATLVGIGTTEAVAATLLGRAISLAVIFILGPIFSYVLLKHNPQPNLNPKSDSTNI